MNFKVSQLKSLGAGEVAVDDLIYVIDSNPTDGSVKSKKVSVGDLIDSRIYGISSSQFVLITGYYANPSWILSLDWSKIINAPSFVTSLSALTDVTIATPLTGQGLVYNGTKWVNQGIGELDTLNSVTTRGNITTNAIVIGSSTAITASPYTLQVIGGSGGSAIFSNAAKTQGLNINLTTAGETRIYGDYFGAGVDQKLILGTFANRVTQLVLQTSGNIGIGTTTDAGFKLDVNGTARVVNQFQVGSFTSGVAGASSTIVTQGRISASGGVTLYNPAAGDNQETGIFPGSGLVIKHANGNVITFTNVGGAANGTNVNITQGYNPGAGSGSVVGYAHNYILYPSANNTVEYTSYYSRASWNSPANYNTTTGPIRGFYFVNSLYVTQKLIDVVAFESNGGRVVFAGELPSASGGISRGVYVNQTLTAAANNDVLVGLDIDPTFTNGAFTGVQNMGLRVNSQDGAVAARFVSTSGSLYIVPRLSSVYGTYIGTHNSTQTAQIPLSLSANRFIFDNGNVLIGTTTDAGYKLDVNGTARFTGVVTGPDGSNFNGTIFDGAGTKRIRPVNNTLDITDGSGNVCFQAGPTGPKIGQSFDNVEFVLGLNSMVFSAGATQIMKFTLKGQRLNHLDPYADIAITGYAPTATNKNTTLRIYTTNTTSGIYGNIILSHDGVSKTGNILIGTNNNVSSAIVNVESTTQGFLPPRLTTIQKNAITTPATGLEVYDSTTNTPNYYNGTTWVGVASNQSTGLSPGLFAQTSDSTPIVNTTVETTLISTGVGTLTVPANQFQVGASYVAYLSGVISSQNNATMEIHLRSNGSILADTNPMTFSATTAKFWEMSVNFTVRAIGGGGVAAIVTSGRFSYNKDSGNIPESVGYGNVNSTTFDTTVNNSLVITAQWGNASPLNSIQTRVFNLYRVY